MARSRLQSLLFLTGSQSRYAILFYPVPLSSLGVFQLTGDMKIKFCFVFKNFKDPIHTR